MERNNTPLIALFWFACKCGQVVKKGETYYSDKDKNPMCGTCALPELEPRKLKLIRTYLKTA